MKILVIILSERRDHRYIKMEKAIRETWAPKLLQNDSIVDVLYTYGREHRGIRGEVEKTWRPTLHQSPRRLFHD